MANLNDDTVESVVVIAHDHSALHNVITRLKERALVVVGPYTADDVDKIARPSDCAILDLSSRDPALRNMLGRLARSLAPHVVLITEHADFRARIAAVRLGVSEQVVAPFEIDEVLAHIDVMLARRRRVRSSRLTGGDITVLLGERRAIRAGVDVPLTAREFDVLVVLMRARGRAVSKGELLRMLWNDEQRNVNAVEAHVSGLRRKLDGLGASVIQTVHRAGYAFRPTRPAAPSTRDALLAERARLVRERDEAFQRRDELFEELNKKFRDRHDRRDR